MAGGGAYRDLGGQALAWVLAQVRLEPDGLWLPTTITTEDSEGSTEPDEFRDSIYEGLGGLAILLAEVRLTRAWAPDEQAVAARIVERLTTTARKRQDATLYGGLAGDVVALRLLAPDAEVGTLTRLVELATPDGWLSTEGQWAGMPVTDIVMGTAGVVLTGVWHGSQLGLEVARRGADALLRAAEPVADGFDWRMSSATARLMPNYSHGTAGVVAALAMAGQALAEDRYLEAARLGAEHLVAVADRTGGGFRLPICIPWLPRDGEEYTYSWCHGPSGTAYTFAALEHVGVGPIGGTTPKEWRRRCLHSMRTSGIPQRLRPGFWDNDGRCCGTAGAGAAFLDAAQAEAAPNADGEAYADQCVAFARHLADALVERAIVDETGARWRFTEHRLGQPLLPPGTGWMQGAAGIAAFLLRLSRVLDEGLDAAVVDLPDQWWAVRHEVTLSRGSTTRHRHDQTPKEPSR
ncbi:lanthionine synthetase LanC family protein [Lapillicoccus sp.]|uniref:lanthionine synthetase LanC family protein n=1 Tax=Lapillicoccus sp. TaxID=1909287 RepID=UPI00326523E1